MKSAVAFLLLVCFLATAGCGSCGNSSSTPEGGPQESAAASQVGADGGTAVTAAAPREAFGLPFPPEVITVREYPQRVVIDTKLSLDEVESFYKSRLVDFEFVRPKKTHLRVVGLRDYMPSVWATPRGRRWAPTTVRLYPPKQRKDDVVENKGKSVIGADGAITRNDSKPRKGDPVTLTTEDGELLAPGARWGEPYHPPPGSPLAAKRFRANWGEPFGEWHPD